MVVEGLSMGICNFACHIWIHVWHIHSTSQTKNSTVIITDGSGKRKSWKPQWLTNCWPNHLLKVRSNFMHYSEILHCHSSFLCCTSSQLFCFSSVSFLLVIINFPPWYYWPYYVLQHCLLQVFFFLISGNTHGSNGGFNKYRQPTKTSAEKHWPLLFLNWIN